MKVFLNATRFQDWGGGKDFIRLLTRGLLAAPDLAHAELEVVVARPSVRRRLLDLLGRVRLRMLGAPAAQRIAHDLLDTLRRGSTRARPIGFREVGDLRRELAEAGNDAVLLPSLQTLGATFPVPWIGYLYDFQHRHLPDLFSPRIRRRRDKQFAAVLRDASVVVVNSASVRRDVERFFPSHHARLVTLPFCPLPEDDWFELDVAASRAKYGIAKPYFMICNQFWRHKDHPTALRAFHQLRDGARSDVTLICTGELRDDRHPAHVQACRDLIGTLRLTDHVRLLGHIPKRDQIALLRGAIAVIQPTRFEGGAGGGAANDAIAMGRPILLSDIPVNRELVSDLAAFFPPADAASLAGLMRDQLLHPAPEIPPEVLRARAAESARALGAALATAIRLAREGS